MAQDFKKTALGFLTGIIVVVGCAQNPALPDMPDVPGCGPTHKSFLKYAGIKQPAPPGYWYEDTTEITKPRESFGLYSDQANQKILFIVNDDMSPVNDLTDFALNPPYTGVHSSDAKAIKVDEGSQSLGNGSLHWFVGHYVKDKADSKERSEDILTAAYQSPVKGKSIIVVGRVLKQTANQYDYKTTLWLIDQIVHQ